MTRLSNRRSTVGRAVVGRAVRKADSQTLWCRPARFLAAAKSKLPSSLDARWTGEADSRLKSALRRSHRRRKKPVLSRLRSRLEAKQAQRRRWQRSVMVVTFGLGLGATLVTNLFIQEKITVGGVPYRVISKFWNDPQARNAYFAADNQALHDRLQSLGVEEDIKAFYRDRFDTEYELDHHIHQIMFDRTGYVGEAYEVNDHGRLVSVKYKSSNF